MYQEFATEMAATNHYASGRAWESVGYTTNGEADDWGWGEAHAVSLTVEVGSSSDSFWPTPSRILPIAKESALPARYAAWAAGAMMQLDDVSITSNADGLSGSIVLTIQNNGLASFNHDHVVCIHASSPSEVVQESQSWTFATEDRSGSKLCVTIGALKARSISKLPSIMLRWTAAQKWISFMLSSRDSHSSGRIDMFQVKVQNSPATLKSCDSLCVCPSADSTLIDYSHECRAAVAPGSHCAMSKSAHIGSNWASGVVDEHFKYTATQYTRGGKCTVGSTKRDTLVAVYATCARFGAQMPLGFANSEAGRTATVSFPCAAGSSYYIFWNAEYMPNRFSFSISETCGAADCARAHRHRLLSRRHKQRRAK